LNCWQEPYPVPPDKVLTRFGQSPKEVVESVDALELPGLWLTTGTGTQLSVEVSDLVDAGTVACGAVLHVDVNVTVRTADGVIEATSGVLAKHPGGRVLHVPLPDLAEDHRGRVNWGTYPEFPNGLFGSDPVNTDTPVLEVAFDYQDDPFAAVIHEGRVLGAWARNRWDLPSGPPVDYTPPPELTTACDGAERFLPAQSGSVQYTSYPSADAAKAGIAGAWARCRDDAPSNHVGIQILPDGSWRRLALENGELVARSGFEEEGTLRLTERTPMNDHPGFEVSLAPFGRHPDSELASYSGDSFLAWDQALVIPSSADGWPGAVYLPTTLRVRSPVAEFADGERAGETACAHGEQDMLPGIESAATLTGDYVLCSGALNSGVTRIHFDETEVDLLDADGGLIGRYSHTLDAMNGPPDETPRLRLMLRRGDERRQWSIVVSRSPMKIRITEGTTAVFSAMP
jgi:hypothetical protein